MDDIYEKYDPHDTVTFGYDKEDNRFIDMSFGHVIHNIYEYVHPWQVFLFKRELIGLTFPDVTGKFLVELYHLDAIIY